MCTVDAMQNGHANASETVPCLKPPIQRVLVVGAGIAGLSAAHALQKQGIAFDVVDAQAEPGGLWASGYEGLKAQGAGSLLSCFRLMAIHYWKRTDMHRNASLGSLIQCMPSRRRHKTACMLRMHFTKAWLAHNDPVIPRYSDSVT
jgi:2-polyprenyl-6-methoxyphenol hydroxylase-like FAD-dependent oxidoreductase